ncbi:MAG TPA: type II secretion protein ATPase [Micavibrio sp.]
MSESDTSHTSVLLPSARVTLYTRDADTRAAFEAIAKDWRFARVTLDVTDGDVNTAIDTYTQYASPELVIIQTEEISDAFSDRIEALGGVCGQSTSAIIIGPVNDVNLYRRLVAMGVSDYLVKPIKTEPLSHDIAGILLKKIGATGSRLISVMGGKGGVGVSLTAQTLAWATSGMLQQKTFLLDAAGGWSTLSVGMGYEPTTTLAEAVKAAAENREDSLSRMIHQASDKLFVLSSGVDTMLDDNVSPEYYDRLLDYLMAIYPLVIVDLSQSPPALRRIVLKKSHKILLLTAPSLPSVRATRTLLQEIKDLRGGSHDAAEVIVNMHGYSNKHEVNKTQIEQGLDRKINVVLPFDADVFAAAESQSRKMTLDKVGIGVAEKLLSAVRGVLSNTGSTVPHDEDKKGGLGGLFTKLKAKG